MESSSSDGLKKFRDSNGRTTGPTRRSTKGQWTVQEDEILRNAVERFKGKNWKKIAECIKDRSDVQCLHRWQKVLDPELVKGPWTKEEDDELTRLVGEYGAKKWSTIAKRLNGRIGKQCRERWHNHLNPEINKEAWTQEEEIMLIQAHQVYGNKWAELTKFLPGRTDNSIKNHWNSSVKKKLDTYLSSGMLSQFISLPFVSHTNQSTPTSSRTQQGSAEGEEISECSQGSSFMRFSEPNKEMAKEMVVYTGEEDQSADISKVIIVDETQLPVDSNHVNDPSGFPKESQPCGVANFSDFIEQHHSHDLQNPLDSRGETEFLHSIDFDQNQEAATHSIPNCEVNKVFGSDTATQMLTPKDDRSRLSNSYQQSNCQIPHAGTLNSLSYRSELLVDASCSQPPPVTSNSESNQFNGSSFGNQVALRIDDDTRNTCIFNDQDNVSYRSEHVGAASCSQPPPVTSNSESNQFHRSSVGNQAVLRFNEDTRNTCIFNDQDGVSYHSELLAAASCSQPPPVTSNSESNQFHGSSVRNQAALRINHGTRNTCILNDEDNVWALDKSDKVTDSLDLLPADGFSSGQFHATQAGENNVLDTHIFNDQVDVLTLDKKDQVMDPLDVVSAGGFSSGQLHATQANENNVLEAQQQETRSLSYEPPRIPGLDSPFLSCDLIDTGGDLQLEYSPLGIRQLMSSINCYSPCRLWDSPSDHDSPEAVLKSASKTFNCTPTILKKRNRDLLSPLSEKRNFTFFNSLKDLNQVYENKNQQLPSSSQTVDSGAITIEDKENLNPNDEMVQKDRGKNTTINMQQPAGVSGEHNLDGDLRNDTSVESLQMFEETPLKKNFESPSSWKSPWLSFESPSAWKSPWLPFAPGPRVDTDITIEDFGYFTSPGEKSYDALGLMKQLSERTASAYANAREVLGDETPDSILKKRLSEKSRRESNILSERRALDFTECGSPMKRERNARHPSGVSFSSPSSYLLKGCR
uniref:transcription factor MYB3R-4 n=1 Tax=Erigeron canadensis TaxID=72917 RepID=UPI001CB8A6CB|nr:transcription factor MYB3R-4 [Erigeron canadensis]